MFCWSRRHLPLYSSLFLSPFFSLPSSASVPWWSTLWHSYTRLRVTSSLFSITHPPSSHWRRKGRVSGGLGTVPDGPTIEGGWGPCCVAVGAEAALGKQNGTISIRVKEHSHRGLGPWMGHLQTQTSGLEMRHEATNFPLAKEKGGDRPVRAELGLFPCSKSTTGCYQVLAWITSRRRRDTRTQMTL